MLRATVLLLLLANGAYYAWAQGLLLPWGWGPLPQAEPYRLQQQVRPEAMRILPAGDERPPESVAASRGAAECLQAGPLPEAAAEPLRKALASWPSGAWSLQPVDEPARWIVYMGQYANAAEVERKKGELRQIGIAFEPMANPDLEPGVSLGGFASQQAAEQQLDRLVARGVRTARVVQERPETRGQRLTLPTVDDALRPRLEELRALLNDKPLRPCR